METNNNGVIGIVESRENVEKIKAYYRSECKKIRDEQNKTNHEYFKNKWRVRFGQFGLNLGFTFASKPVKIFGKLGTNIISGITKKVMKIKNKLYNKDVERRLNKLNADFINLDGDFKEFAIENKLNVEEIDSINNNANYAVSI